MYSLALIIFVVSEKKAFEYFPIGSNVNLCPAVAAILNPTKLQMFVEYDTLGRLYSISALMKQDNITEMHIYVK